MCLRWRLVVWVHWLSKKAWGFLLLGRMRRCLLCSSPWAFESLIFRFQFIGSPKFKASQGLSQLIAVQSLVLVDWADTISTAVIIGRRLRLNWIVHALSRQTHLATQFHSQREQTFVSKENLDYFIKLLFWRRQKKLLHQSAFFELDNVLRSHESDKNETLGQVVLQLAKVFEPVIFVVDVYW